MVGIVVYHFRRTRARYWLSILAPLTLLSWYVSYRYPSPASERVLRHPDASILQAVQGAYGNIAMGHEEAQQNELWDASFSWPSHKRKNEKAINASGTGWMTSSEILQQYPEQPSASISRKLTRLLRKIEDEELIKRHELVKNLVMVVEAKTRRLEPAVSRSRDLQLYDLLVQSLGLRRDVLIGSEGVEKAFDRLGKHGNSSILLCVPETVHICASKWVRNKPKIYKVNAIPPIHERLVSPVQLCHTQRNLTYPKQPCFVLPHHLDDFLTAAEILPPSGGEWLVQEDDESNILQTAEVYELIRNKFYSVNHPVVVRHYVNPLSLGDKPVHYVQVLTTVTSWRPLRTHQYDDGFIFLRDSCATRDCQTNFQSTLPLAMLKGMEAKLRNAAARELATLLAATENDFAGIQTCSNCFQLLAVDLMVESDCQKMEMLALRAFPTSHFKNGHGRVANNKNLMSRAESSLFYQRWLIDSLKLIMNRETVSEAVQRPLEHVIANLNLGIVGLNSQVDHDLALTEPDLAYLIHTYQEWKASPECHFHLTYPSTEPATLSLPAASKRFLLPLHHWESYRHSTTDLHKILTSFARQMIRLERENESQRDKLRSNSSLHYNAFSSELVLYGLEFDYDLVLSPSFRPDWFEYHGQVPYHVEKLQIRVIQLEPGVPRRQILLDDDIDLTGGSAAVISLGLGLNSCRLKVVSSPVANWTYTLRITRQERVLPAVNDESSYPATPAYAAYSTCALFQNCNVRFAPDQPCGLYPLASTASPDSNWSVVSRSWSNLPLCTTGDAPGRWVLPCQDCANSSTCHWELQRWQPLDCQYPRNTLTTRQLRSCVTNKKVKTIPCLVFENKVTEMRHYSGSALKNAFNVCNVSHVCPLNPLTLTSFKTISFSPTIKVLFLGDSTNRGMMHQFLERLNGTLTNGDKIHDIRHYRAVTPAAWHVAFAYYPQFWWPATQRPSFEQLLHQLFLSAGPLENNTNTVLVVGGVQWMAASHVPLIRRQLSSEGLEGIQVIIKTLGSGFHLPVNGVHRLTQEQVPKLYQQSLKLAQEAKKAGMGVVDTFVMTTSRSQDFLPGRCACHFHQVINTTPIERPKKVWPSVVEEEAHTYETFRVKGAINALYTEILISQLCGQPHSHG